MNRSFAKVYFLITTVIIFGLLFHPGMLFYESKLYVQYLASMIADYDFNLINQVPKSMAWLVTKTYFHPDQHPETQTALMLPFYILEYLARKLSFSATSATAFNFQFALATLAMNIFNFYVGWHFIKKICISLNLKFKKSDVIFFSLGSALFYFGFLQTSVLEIAAFPLITYLIWVYLNLKNNNLSNSPTVVGIVSAFLVVSKITFWPIAIPVLVFCIYSHYKNKNWSKLYLLAIPFLLIVSAFTINRFIKYGFYLLKTPPLEPFFNYTLENFYNALVYGFFPQGGVIFANPIWLFAIVGFIALLIHLKKIKKINFAECAVCVFWFSLLFFGHVFIAGYMVEDHLPGRIHLGFLPLLILGFIYVRNLIPERFKSASIALFSIFCAWHLFITFSYLISIQESSLAYSNHMIPQASAFQGLLYKYTARIRDNISAIGAHLVHILIFTTALSIIFYNLKKSSRKESIIKYFSILCAAIFIFMSGLNYTFYSKNIADLQEKGFFENCAIGNGNEIFYLDYVMQYVSTVKMRCSPALCEKLDLGVKKYYDKVSEQVIKSTPALDFAIKNNSTDFSIWIDIENEK